MFVAIFEQSVARIIAFPFSLCICDVYRYIKSIFIELFSILLQYFRHLMKYVKLLISASLLLRHTTTFHQRRYNFAKTPIHYTGYNFVFFSSNLDKFQLQSGDPCKDCTTFMTDLQGVAKNNQSIIVSFHKSRLKIIIEKLNYQE